jgi:hypothetical protein
MTLKAGIDADAAALERTAQTLEAGKTQGRVEVSHADAEDGMSRADTANVPPDAAAPPADDATRSKPIPRSPGDQKRLDMQARFRAQRDQETTDTEAELAELRALQRHGLPPDMVDVMPPEGEEEEQPVKAAEPPPPVKRKLKVRGQEVELTDEEIIAAAQKTLAGDSYMDDARSAADKAKALAQEIEAMRSGLQSGKHPAGAQETQTPVQPVPEPAPPEHSEELQALLREIQYGDPNDPAVAQKLQGFIDERAKKAASTAADASARQAVQEQRERDEVENSKRALTAWTQANADLAKDDLAMSVMERRLFAHFIQDLTSVGFDVSKLRTNDDVANMHMRMRANGHKVRSVEQIFDQAKGEYLAWKGITPAPAADETTANEQPPAEPRPASPRIEVTVNREARRANIPTQPPRSASPQRAPLVGDSQPVDPADARSQVVQRMQQNRRSARNSR